MIEVIAVLLLMGVVGVTMMISLLPMSQALMQTRDHVESFHKASLGLERIKRELTTITNVVYGGASQLVYEFLDSDGITHQHTMSWGGASGDPLLLEGIPLVDDVRHFHLSYYPDGGSAAHAQWSHAAPLIEIVLRVQDGVLQYTNRVYPRNLRGGGGG